MRVRCYWFFFDRNTVDERSIAANDYLEIVRLTDRIATARLSAEKAITANVNAQWAYNSAVACANAEVVRPLNAVLYEASSPRENSDGHSFSIILEPNSGSGIASLNAATTFDQACRDEATMDEHLLIIRSNEVRQALQGVGVEPTAIAVARN